jgi:hypothetical protein
MIMQIWRVHALPLDLVQMNYFWAGPDLVRWSLEVVETTHGSHIRLTMFHAGGTIVEYFRGTEAALGRAQELAELLVAARGFAALAPTGMCR